MTKESWGIKRTCPCGNGVRFYDLNKKEIECPSCGETINVERLSISNLENSLRKVPKKQNLNDNDKLSNEGDVVKDTSVTIDDNKKIQVEEITGVKKKR